MTRITLVLLFALSLLVSFSVQAGSRHGHQHKHHGGHHNKHQRHHNGHRGHHYYSHGGHRYRHDSHYSYGLYPKFNTVPRVPPGTRYGYSDSGAVIVYQPYPYRNERHGYDH